MDVDEEIVAANMEVSWTTSAAGDRVEYWISADGGTHWVTVTNNETCLLYTSPSPRDRG